MGVGNVVISTTIAERDIRSALDALLFDRLKNFEIFHQPIDKATLMC